MRLKKAFTLSEILIVLMVIGVIATMTIPSMMRGVVEAQIKTGYKKAYNTIVNFAATERLAGSLPSKGEQIAANHLMFALAKSLSVTAFAHQILDAGDVPKTTRYYPCANLNLGNGATATIGIPQQGKSCIGSEYLPQRATNDNTGTVGTPVWMITEDNIAYTVLTGGITCNTSQVIQAQQTLQDVIKKSCFVIVADVNGINKGPNSIEKQTQALLQDGVSMSAITGDRLQIYVGIDGATAGPRSTTVTGRIAADLK